jgi:hypothetical protein
MTKDLDKWKREHSANIEQELGTTEGLYSYIQVTVNNFAYRYIETDHSGEVEIQSPQQGFFVCEAEERDMNRARQTENQKVLKGLERKNPKSLRNILMVSVSDFNGKSGNIDMVGVVHWGEPEFAPNSPDQHMKKVQFKFSDVMEFRNDFAKYLEQACEVF